MEEEEAMNCLLSMSRMPGAEELSDAPYWSNCQDAGEGTTIVWKFDGEEGLVQIPTEYKGHKYVIAQNLLTGDTSAEAMPQGKVVLLQNTTSQPTEVGYLSSALQPCDPLPTLESYATLPEPAASSSSESIDVEVEDSDPNDDFRNGPPEIISPPRKTIRRGAPVKRKIKRTQGWLKKLKEDVEMQKKAKQKRSENGKPEALKYNELTELEDNADQVTERFNKGCECPTNCFEGFSAEKVFRHRLNIADLTKAEHDMYLMGVIHTSMQNPDETCRKKERLRIRTTYAYYGRRVCLTAFLYLEHVTLYQMKRIRKHLQHHGVSPRIHGNHGRKPSNTLPLDIYQQATQFVRTFIEQHNQESKLKNSRTSYRLPPECTKKILHEAYRSFCQQSVPCGKIMQYSTFTNFFKKQFPHVKFRKIDKFVERRVDDQMDCEEKLKRRRRKKKDSATVVDAMATAASAEAVEEQFSQYVIVGSEVLFTDDDAPFVVHTPCDRLSHVKREEIIRLQCTE